MESGDDSANFPFQENTIGRGKKAARNFLMGSRGGKQRTKALERIGGEKGNSKDLHICGVICRMEGKKESWHSKELGVIASQEGRSMLTLILFKTGIQLPILQPTLGGSQTCFHLKIKLLTRKYRDFFS